ncbi:hypothetical protein [Anaerocolumna sp.]|uniref:hypothetical protein n=1 Tax=Anaerocolumna sp. TaxID=2041569 RepID=UPI0028AC2E79|nr:hypothetical protein [Anaerocolumna sp.]
MKPNLITFKNENIQNQYINFEKKMKPRIDWDNKWGELSETERNILLGRSSEIHTLVDNAVFEFYMDESSENSLCSNGEFFPDRTVLTGNYYIGKIHYIKQLKDEKGHPYDKKGDRYRDLWSRDKSGNYTHFVDSMDNLKFTYQVIIEARLTSLEQGVEKDYVGIDFSLELKNINSEIEVEILSHDVI